MTATTDSETEIRSLKYNVNSNLWIYSQQKHLFPFSIILVFLSHVYLYFICEKQMWKPTWKYICYSCEWFTESWHIQQEYAFLQVATARKPVATINS